MESSGGTYVGEWNPHTTYRSSRLVRERGPACCENHG